MLFQASLSEVGLSGAGVTMHVAGLPELLDDVKMTTGIHFSPFFPSTRYAEYLLLDAAAAIIRMIACSREREICVNEKSIVRDGYNAIAAKYLPTRSADSEDVQLLLELSERLPKGAKVLDAGCGAGVPVTRILSRLFDVTGVDFSEQQIRLARQLVPEAHFLCSDITQLTLADQSFDAICSYYAIIHIPRQEHRALISSFHRMLKPSGLVLLCLGADDLREDHQIYLGAPMYWSHYDAKTNLNLVKECGFDIIWSKVVADSTSPGASHLFVMAQRSGS